MLGFMVTVIAVAVLYALKRSALFAEHWRHWVKLSGWGLLGLALGICLFEYGCWKGLFIHIAMLMVTAISMPFLFPHLKTASE